VSKRREKRKKRKKIHDRIRVKDASKPGPGTTTKKALVDKAEELRKSGKIVNCVLCGRDMVVPGWIQNMNQGGEKTNTMTLECSCGGRASITF
jgi:hypothetical protein